MRERQKRREPLGCDPAAALDPFCCDCAAPVHLRRSTLAVDGGSLYQAPLIVDVESFNKVTEDVEILVARFSDLLLDAIGALAQYA